jgi:hypothetical protein
MIRILVILPILRLALAAGVFFVVGGYNLIAIIVEGIVGLFTHTHLQKSMEKKSPL